MTKKDKKDSFFSGKNSTFSRFFYWFAILIIAFIGYRYSTKYTDQHIENVLNVPHAPALFVNKNSLSEIENGSALHPFKEIQSALALTKIKPSFNFVYISPGSYEEKLALPPGVALIGTNEKTKIINPEKKGSIIVTSDDNLLSNLEIIGGRYGILIPSEGKDVIINDCVISEAKRWGIYSVEIDEERDEEEKGEEGEEGEEGEKEENKEEEDEIPKELAPTKLSIIKSQITKNTRQGIYLQKGYLYINNSEFIQNGEEGVDLHVGMHSIIKNSRISENGEGGLETELGKVNLLIEDCIFEKNGSSGINIQSLGRDSEVLIKNSSINNNTNFGIRCAIHSDISLPYFSAMVIIEENNEFSENGKDPIDPYCSTR